MRAQIMQETFEVMIASMEHLVRKNPELPSGMHACMRVHAHARILAGCQALLLRLVVNGA